MMGLPINTARNKNRDGSPNLTISPNSPLHVRVKSPLEQKRLKAPPKPRMKEFLNLYQNSKHLADFSDQFGATFDG